MFSDMEKLSIIDRVTRNYQFKTFDRQKYLRAKELVERYRQLYEDKHNEVISYSYNEFDYNEDTNGTLFYLMWSVPQRKNETEKLEKNGIEKIEEMVDDLKA